MDNENIKSIVRMLRKRYINECEFELITEDECFCKIDVLDEILSEVDDFEG